METKRPHVHIVGICGVATSAMAIAFHKKGWKVTGSDKGIFPPVSTTLEQAGVTFYTGWHPEKMTEAGTPDFVMTGGIGGSASNPEVVYARENDIPVYAFAEVIQKYFIKKNSIVTVGTWGKTTSSALLSYILIKANYNPSYFTGGISLSHDTGALSDSDWSVVEGDEYQVSISNKQPKFNYYSPSHLLLTSVSWDHADLYPTEKDYFAAFEKLVKSIPATGCIVACSDDAGVRTTLAAAQRTAITYGKDFSCDYYYHSVEHIRAGLSITIDHKGSTYIVRSPMLGRYNAENIAGTFAMAHQVGIAPEVIIGAIASFEGIKRRLERRYQGASVTVLDCHAPTAEKAKSILESVHEVYPDTILAIFEPNIGGRQKSSSSMYAHAFRHADTILIPRLTRLKIAANETETALEGDELTAIIAQTHSDVHYVEDDVELVSYIKEFSEKNPNTAITFLGSHGFRGMIEATIAALQK